MPDRDSTRRVGSFASHWKQEDFKAETEIANESICRYWILDSTVCALFICNLAGFKRFK
jgi:hypothetical protein